MKVFPCVFSSIFASVQIPFSLCRLSSYSCGFKISHSPHSGARILFILPTWGERQENGSIRAPKARVVWLTSCPAPTQVEHDWRNPPRVNEINEISRSGVDAPAERGQGGMLSIGIKEKRSGENVALPFEIVSPTASESVPGIKVLLLYILRVGTVAMLNRK